MRYTGCPLNEETDMQIDQGKCAHKPCKCMVGPNEKYCSASCEKKAAAQDTNGCDCHHGDCDMSIGIPLSAVGGA